MVFLWQARLGYILQRRFSMPVVRYDVLRPGTVEEVLKALSQHGEDAQVIAGGTDLLRSIRMGTKKPKILISLDLVTALVGVLKDQDGNLCIGSLTTMAEMALHPEIKKRGTALSEAASWMGSPQVRNRATLGGNLCNARPCADSAPPGIVLDAVLVLKSAKSERRVPVRDFMTGPGQTVRRPDELLTKVLFPTAGPHSGSAYARMTNRKAVEITITSAASGLSLASPKGPVQSAKICLGSVGPTPICAPSAEAELVGHEPNEEVLRKAAAAAVSDCKPIDDLRGSAAYRRWMVEVLVRRTLQSALDRARGAA
jgi:CO/xanthine dehydrogenase FAD-binding subunit